MYNVPHMRQLVLLSHIFLVLSPLLAQKTTYHFEVLHNNKKIGTLTATKETNGTHVTKTISSKSSTKILLLNLHVESEIKVSTLKEVLIQSSAYRTTNHGQENTQTKVLRIDDNQYKMVKNEKERIINRKEIKFCVSDLYFKEPTDIRSVFSETHGEELPLETRSANTYQITLPNGNKSTYYYANGMLRKVVSESTVGEVVFRKK